MLSYLVIFCILIVIAGLLFYFLKLQAFKKRKFVVPQEFLLALKDFKTEVDSVHESVHLLESFAGDYFMTLNESGFKELCDISEALISGYESCSKLIQEQKLQEAEEILDYIYTRKGEGEPPANLSIQLQQGSERLKSWRDHIRTRVEIIDKNLNHASEEFQRIGRVRRSARKPTSTILGEVRKVVFGDSEVIPNPENKKDN